MHDDRNREQQLSDMIYRNDFHDDRNRDDDRLILHIETVITMTIHVLQTLDNATLLQTAHNASVVCRHAI